MRVSQKSKVGRKKGITLSSADQAVISSIAREGFQTFGEIRAGAFQSYHRVSAWQRMKRMVCAGYLHECRDDNDGILGWTVNPKGMTGVFVPSGDHSEDGKRAPVYRTAFAHDVSLRDVKRKLMECQAIQEWIPEHILKKEVMRRFNYRSPKDRRDILIAVPDALLSLHSGGEDSKAVLELELTQKSRRRLYQKFESYVTSPDFDYAFFVAKDEKLKQLLMKVYGEVLLQSNRVKLVKTRNGIYFTTLDALQKQGVHAKFSGTHDSLSFADLSD